jgi:hypothetical protein
MREKGGAGRLFNFPACFSRIASCTFAACFPVRFQRTFNAPHQRTM